MTNLITKRVQNLIYNLLNKTFNLVIERVQSKENLISTQNIRNRTFGENINMQSLCLVISLMLVLRKSDQMEITRSKLLFLP